VFRRWAIILGLLLCVQSAEARTRVGVDVDLRDRPRITRYRTVRRFGWHSGTHYGPYTDENGVRRIGWHTGTHLEWYTLDLPVLDKIQQPDWEVFVRFGKDKRLRLRGDANVRIRRHTTIRPIGGRLLSWVDAEGRVISIGTGKETQIPAGSGWSGRDMGNSIIMVGTPAASGVEVFVKQKTKALRLPGADDRKDEPTTRADRRAEAQRDKLLDEADRRFALGLYPQAAMLYQQAMKLDRNDALARFSVAHSLFALGLYKLAGQNVRHGLDAFPEWGLVDLDLRKFYVNPETFTAKLADLQRHVKANPEDRDARILLGYICYFSGQREQGTSYFRELAQHAAGDEHAALFINLEAYELIGIPAKTK
jgi:hypothetical protein